MPSFTFFCLFFPPPTDQLNNFILLNTSSSLAYLAFSSSTNPEADIAVLNINLFNCTNPDAVVLGATPVLEPVGPLLLWVRHEIIDTNYDNNNNILNYKDYKYYVPWETDGDPFATGVSNTLTPQELEYKQRYLNTYPPNPSSFSLTNSQEGTPSPSMIVTLTTKITSLYMPLVTLVAHGYGPSSFEEVYNTQLQRTEQIPTKVRQIITGDCENYNSQFSSSTSSSSSETILIIRQPDEYGCMLTMDEYAAATTLRRILSVVVANTNDSTNNDDPSTNTLFVDRSIQELLFGYADPIFEALNVLNSEFPKRYPGILGNTTSRLEAHRQNGYNRVYTGNNDPTVTNNFVAWDNMNELYCCAAGPCGGSEGSLAKPAWASTWANIVQGSRLDQFQPNLQSTDILRVFSDNFIRTMDLSYQPNIGTSDDANDDTTNNYGNIPTLRFGYDPVQFANVLNFPPNEAYYSTPSLPSGLLNTTTCSLGRVPLFYSKPYFLDGNQTLNNGAGLPLGQSIAHDTWVDIEPLTGKTLSSHYRHQMNVYVDSMPMPSVSKTNPSSLGRSLQGGNGGLFPSLSPVYFPLMWIDYTMETSPVWLNTYRNTIQIPFQTASTLKLVSSIIGGFLGIAAIGFVLIGKQRYTAYSTQELQLSIASLLSTHNSSTVNNDTIDGTSKEDNNTSVHQPNDDHLTAPLLPANVVIDNKQRQLLHTLDEELHTLLGSL